MKTISTLPFASLYRLPKDVARFWASKTWILSHCTRTDGVGRSSLGVDVVDVVELRCVLGRSMG